MTITKPTFYQEKLGLILFGVMVFIAIFTFDDYGISWDEPQQRKTGTIAYNYVFNGDDTMLNWFDRDYGVAVELPLIIIEKALGLEDTRDIYLMRHAVTHLLFLLGAFFCFKTIDLIYKNKLLASIGFFLVVLHPRIYAHSFFNPKDLPFLSMLLISFYWIAKSFDTKRLLPFMTLGIITGLLINMRIMGVMVLAGVSGYLFIDIIAKRKRNDVLALLLFWLTACGTLYASWPYLWNNPIHNFIEAFENMSKFRWAGHVQVAGNFLSALELPWWYFPLWMGITTPILFMLLGFFGIGKLVRDAIRSKWKFLENGMLRTQLLFVACFIMPIIMVLALNSVLYDGWRQMYFVYAGFVMTIIYGLNHLFQTKFAKAVKIALFVTFGYTAFFMIQNHPHQQVYFNPIVAFAGDNHARRHHEMDYWAVSSKSCLEYIAKTETSDTIRVFAEEHAGSPIRFNELILPKEDRDRIYFTTRDSADLFITNFRFHYHGYEEHKGREYYENKVGNNIISAVYRMK